MRKLLFALLIIMLLAAGILPMLAAQDEIILTVTVPEFIAGQIRPELFDAFEAEHPGVTIIAEGSTNYPYFTPPVVVGLDTHFEEVESYVSSGDVLFVNAGGLAVETTRAGYLLDLAPLASSDPALNVEDFHPAAWQSFAWDQGIWALPSTLDLITLNYIPEAFDEAGLAYPNPGWTLDDLVNAAQTLTRYDEDGNVETPGLVTMGAFPLLARALTGEGFYDSSVYPETPDLDKPTLVELLETWAAYEEENVNFLEPALMPMRILPTFDLASNYNAQSTNVQSALLPGGFVGMDATGYAVSAGTLYPELAYELAKYLTADAQVNNLMGLRPARQSLVGAVPSEDTLIRYEFSPENAAFLEEALAHALPVSELRYGSYLTDALNRVRTGSDAPSMALQQVMTEALANLEAAAAHRDTTAVMVATPVPTPVLAVGESTVRFALYGESVWEDQKTRWSDLIDAFVAQDPEVGQVIFDYNPMMTQDAFDTLATDFDCFTLPYNAVTAVLPDVHNIDPFLDADPNFDRGDVIAGALAQVTLDNKVWALPMTIIPEVLYYDTAAFEAAGVPLPVNGWTPEVFVDALHRLKLSPDDPPPFQTRSYANHMLSLIAAFGGLPIDTRTEPATLNFTDPQTVAAIRQVLDLARDGYIEYNALSITAEGSRSGFNEQWDGAILVNLLQVGFLPQGSGAVEHDYRPVTYPKGRGASLTTYQVRTGYINADATNPEACYRWLSLVSKTPGLIAGMPARRSVLDDPALAAIFGEEKVDFYRRYDAYLSESATVIMDHGGGSMSDFFEKQWLFAAFDRYVLEGADLEAELAEAETLVTTYRECIASAAPHDPAVMTAEEYYNQYTTDCALKLDPSLGPFFGMPAESE